MANLLRFFTLTLFLCLRDGSAQLLQCEIENMYYNRTDLCVSTNPQPPHPAPPATPAPPSQQPPPPAPPATTSCTCIPHHQCLDDSANEVTINIDDPSQTCSHYLEVCCKNVNKPVDVPNINSSWTCGQYNLPGVGFRVQGPKETASYGEFPWMVALVHDTEGDKPLIGGGSIIHPQVVLTASHSVWGKQDLLILAGEWDAQTDKEQYRVQKRKVVEVIIHESFYSAAHHNNIALLVLDSPLESSPVVSTICLPEQGENMDNRHCLSSGWGKDSFGKEGQYQAILKKVTVDTIPRETCQAQLRGTRLGPKFILGTSLICAAGAEGQDTCKGDGGGPLVCPSKNNPNVYVQAGIVSWGIGCKEGLPAAYTNVPLFRNWIDGKLKSLVNANKI